ncbi:hypothetical protein SDC9_163142 [bioreactor metagenome]|uniref:Uncharacterized protein n=1 Tax=bioreactor metagenome TaxID=1076179 RepID=A0A645FQ40_9ZZZZ
MNVVVQLVLVKIVIPHEAELVFEAGNHENRIPVRVIRMDN